MTRRLNSSSDPQGALHLCACALLCACDFLFLVCQSLSPRPVSTHMHGSDNQRQKLSSSEASTHAQPTLPTVSHQKQQLHRPGLSPSSPTCGFQATHKRLDRARLRSLNSQRSRCLVVQFVSACLFVARQFARSGLHSPSCPRSRWQHTKGAAVGQQGLALGESGFAG